MYHVSWPETWCSVQGNPGVRATRVTDGQEGVFQVTTYTFFPGTPIALVDDVGIPLRESTAMRFLPCMYKHVQNATSSQYMVLEQTSLFSLSCYTTHNDETYRAIIDSVTKKGLYTSNRYGGFDSVLIF